MRAVGRITRIVSFILGVLAVVAGCGGSPSGPSAMPSSPPPPAARDGWTEAPVSAAAFTPSAPSLGARVVVHAPGFLEREAAFVGEPLYLWPQQEAYVRELVYSEYVPWRKLSRWTSAFDVEPLGGEATSVLEDAVAEVRRVSGLSIGIRPGGQVRVVVDPADPYLTGQSVGVAYLTFAGNVITGARLVFSAPGHITGELRGSHDNNLLHELGHALGLGHSSDRDDVMNVGRDGRTNERRFSEREAVALKLMYKFRRAGNTAPDRDPGAGAAAGRTTVITVVD